MLRTEVEGDDVVVRYDDPEHRARHVGVWAHLPLGDTVMRRVPGGWEVRLTELPVDRLEYLLDVDGVLRVDETNPRRTGGPFGDHSWIPLPAYREPWWLGHDPVPSNRTPITVARTPVGRVELELWAPADAKTADRLPLLVSHDGPEMDAYGGLTSYVGALVAAGRLPRMRVALVAAGERNARYAADPAYARALTSRVLPTLRDQVQVEGRPVLIGQSLGALAALHASWTSPGVFAGLLLQSGSFFTPEHDAQESGFEYWHEVIGFVASIHAAEHAAPDAPLVAMTCGTAEENHANNVEMCGVLTRVGVDTSWGEVRDGHTWTCWRDTLDPHLTDLLAEVWA